MTLRRFMACLLALVALGFGLSTSQGGPGPAIGEIARGETATWELAHPAALSSETDRITVLVTRLECANGVTGETLPPEVSYSNSEIIIRVDVQRTEDEVAFCLGNDAVPVTVHLREPIGLRTLIDGGCSDFQESATSCVRSEARQASRS